MKVWTYSKAFNSKFRLRFFSNAFDANPRNSKELSKGNDRLLSKVDKLVKAGVHPVTAYNGVLVEFARKYGNSKFVMGPSLNLLQHMKENNISPNKETYDTTLLACKHAAQWEVALTLLDEMTKTYIIPDGVTYENIICCCANAGQWAECVNLLEWMLHHDLTPTTISFTVAIKACVFGNQARIALGLWDRMLEREVPPHPATLRWVISAFGEDGRWEEALECFRNMHLFGLKPDGAVYGAIISSCSKAKRWKLALDLWRGMGSSSVQPTREACFYSLSSSRLGNQWETAVEILRLMERMSMAPNELCYIMAISACADAGQHKEATTLLVDMLRRKDLKPELIAFNVALKACTKAGQHEEALKVLKLIKHCGLTPDHFSYNSAMAACARAGRLSAVLSLLDQMVAARVAIDTMSLTIALSACGRGQNWDDAMKLWGRMVDDGMVNLMACNTFLDVCAKCGKFSAAGDIFNGMAEVAGAEPDLTTFKIMVRCAGGGGDWRTALWLADEAAARGLKPDAELFTNTISACEAEPNRAVEVFQQMLKKGIAPTVITLNALLTVVSKANQSALALEIFNEYFSRFDLAKDVVSFNIMMGACLRDKRWEEALQFLKMLREANVTPSATTLSAAVAACAQGGRCTMACALLDEMRTREMKIDTATMNDAITASGRAGHWERALGHLATMSSKGIERTEYSYNAAMGACRRAGRWREALALLEELVAHEGLRPNAYSFSTVVDSLLAAGQDALVPDVVRRALDGAVWTEVVRVHQPSSLHGVHVQGLSMGVSRALIKYFLCDDKDSQETETEGLARLWAKARTSSPPDKVVVVDSVDSVDPRVGDGNNARERFAHRLKAIEGYIKHSLGLRVEQRCRGTGNNEADWLVVAAADAGAGGQGPLAT